MAKKDPRLIGLARELRVSQTPAEQTLWRCLRRRELGARKWRRQHPVGPYIVDFYCAELRLVVELDGNIHVGREEHDSTRQRQLEMHGLKVIRFTNVDLRENLEGVLETLWNECAEESVTR